MKTPYIECVRLLPDTDVYTAIATTITEACAAIGKAAESQQAIIHGPAVSCAGGHLVLRWSAEYATIAFDVLRRLLPSDSRQPRSRFHRVDTSPEAVARGYAECIDDLAPTAPIPRNAALSAEYVDETPPLAALAPLSHGESLAEPVAFAPAEVAAPASLGPVVLTSEPKAIPVSALVRERENTAKTDDSAPEADSDPIPPAAPSAVTADGVAIVSGLAVLADVGGGMEPQPGVIKLGPRGVLITKDNMVRVRLDDGDMRTFRPDQLTTVKE